MWHESVWAINEVSYYRILNFGQLAQRGDIKPDILMSHISEFEILILSFKFILKLPGYGFRCYH